MHYEYYRVTLSEIESNSVRLIDGNALIAVVNRDNQKGDIILAYNDNKPFIPDHGVIVKISENGNPENLQVGDAVLFEKYQGFRFRDEYDNDYILMPINKILCVIS